MKSLKSSSITKKSSFGLVVAILLVLFVLLTPWGNRVALQITQQLMPNLKVELSSGSLLLSPRIERLSFENAQISLTADNLAIDWQWRCVWHSELCVTNANIAKLTLDIKDESNDDATALKSASKKSITIDTHTPWPLIIEEFTAQQLIVSSKQATVEVQQTKFSGSWRARDIAINHLAVADAKIVLSSDAQTANHQVQNNEEQYFSADSIAKLQTAWRNISWPIILSQTQIKSFAVATAELRSQDGKLAHNAKDILVSASLNNQAINNLTVSALIDNFPVELAMKGQLTPQFPIDLSLSGAHNFSPLGAQRTALTLRGDSSSIALELTTQGKLNATLSGSASPLNDNLPISLGLTWQPIDIYQQEIAEGSLKFDGTLSDYQLTLDTQLKNEHLPLSSIDLAAHGNLNAFSDIDLVLKNDLGKVHSSGDFRWRDPNGTRIQSSGKLTFDSLKLSSIIEKLPATINGDISYGVALKDEQWLLTISQLGLNGNALERPFNLQGVVDARYNAKDQSNPFGQWSIEMLSLRHGINELTLNGQINTKSALDAKIAIADLGQSLPFMRGAKPTSITGTINATGPIDAIGVIANLSGNHISYPEYAIDLGAISVNAKTKISPQGISESANSHIDVSINQASYSDVLTDAAVSLSLVGDAKQHQLSANITSNLISGTLGLSGSLENTNWTSELTSTVLNYQQSTIALASPAKVAIDLKNKDIDLSKHCWRTKLNHNQMRFSELCLASPFEINTTSMRSNLATVNVTGLDMQDFQAYLPKQHQVTGPITGNLTFQSFNPQALSLATQLVWQDGTVTSDVNNNLVTHHIDSLHINSAVNRTLANVILRLSSPTLGKVDASMLSNVFEESPFISGHLNSQGLQLAPYKPFLRYVSELEGELSVSAGFTIDSKAQQIFGSLSSNDIKIASDKLPNTIDDLNTNVVFNGTKASLTSQFKLVQGHGDISGLLDWSQTPKADLTIKGQALNVMPQNGVDITFSPSINVELTPTLAKIRGVLAIDEANIVLESLPESAVAISPDVTVISQEKESSAMLIDLDVKTQLGDKLHLNAFGLDSLVGGELTLKQDAQLPLSAYGELGLSEATYQAFGQRLLIEQGQIIFTGSVNNPVINIKAIRDPVDTNDGVIAGVYVNGDVNQPALTIFSEPALEQQQAISYLLRGYGLGSDSNYGQNLAIAMLVNSGLGGASKAVNAIGDAVGIDNLNVTTSGSGDQTRLEFSGYIGPKLQLRYGVGVFDALPEVGLRYQVNRRLFVEFINNTDQALDLLYQFSFD